LLIEMHGKGTLSKRFDWKTNLTIARHFPKIL
jgi:hypothetical protein